MARTEIEAAAEAFYDEIAAESDRSARIIEIIRNYRQTMQEAGPPYRYG